MYRISNKCLAFYATVGSLANAFANIAHIFIMNINLIMCFCSISAQLKSP